jgi:CBS domain-containing protein
VGNSATCTDPTTRREHRDGSTGARPHDHEPGRAAGRHPRPEREDGRLRGIVTDRDIVVRGVADFDDLSTCSLGDVCSDQLLTAAPDEDASAAITRMRGAAVRRIPVVDGGRPVGVLSIGDAAIERDSGSVLADISVEEGNT